ncbi:MAG: exodeoxyribonuclease VII small subunit [Ignavibacteria bacterium]|nr:exodeoxyribonuclease VII small subunit [Ignavibacteria bacterium]
MSKLTTKTSFEASLKRLETIVESLENGDVTVEESLNMYEEGMTLSQQCMEKLTQAEIKLQRITKNLDGTFELFDSNDVRAFTHE